MTKEIQKSFCMIESRAGAIAIEHIQLLGRIRFCTIPARPYIWVMYGIRYVYTPYIVKIYGWRQPYLKCSNDQS
jgi:hypothetical protein